MLSGTERQATGPVIVPYDQRLARILVRRLAGLPLVSPNLLTLVSLLLALAGAAGIAAGGEPAPWGALLFALGRFMDHTDGELARLTGRSSRLGYYLDYLAGAASYAALFLALGFASRAGVLGDVALLFGAAAAAAALIAMAASLRLDRLSATGDAPYPAFGGFELEDGIYVLPLVAWAGVLEPFFYAACGGAALYTLWRGLRLLSARARPGADRGDRPDRRPVD